MYIAYDYDISMYLQVCMCMHAFVCIHLCRVEIMHARAIQRPSPKKI